jgi:hypothetical protein
MIIYLLGVKPLSLKFMNNLEIFNELSILIVSSHLYLFTPLVDDPDFQYIAGWSIILVTTMNVSVNMIILLYQGFKSMIL